MLLGQDGFFTHYSMIIKVVSISCIYSLLKNLSYTYNNLLILTKKYVIIYTK